jgi:hypothetical protein
LFLFCKKKKLELCQRGKNKQALSSFRYRDKLFAFSSKRRFRTLDETLFSAPTVHRSFKKEL